MMIRGKARGWPQRESEGGDDSGFIRLQGSHRLTAFRGMAAGFSVYPLIRQSVMQHAIKL